MRRIGVEEELLLVDPSTCRPVPAAGELVRAVAHGSRPASVPGPLLEQEVKTEQIEVVSPPLLDLNTLYDAIVKGRRAADDFARAHGARAVALATSPLACEPHLVASPRYLRMQEEFGLTMDEQLTCGFHVHVTVDSAEEGVAVLDRIRPWLPAILALSANSPFWRGTDSRFASYRYQAWGRWPTAGPYPLFGNAAEYARIVDVLLETEVAFDPGMMYFDARLSAHAPTIETRIADVCLDPEDAAVLAVLVRALVERSATMWRAGEQPERTPLALLRLASWRASRSGVAGPLLDPGTGRPVPAAEAVGALLHHVDAHFAHAAEREAARAGIAEILRRGSGANTQREAAEAGGPHAAVVAALARSHARARGD